MKQFIQWHESLENIRDDAKSLASVVKRNQYFCSTKTFPSAVGKDIYKVAKTSAKSVSPYPTGQVSYWVKKTIDGYVVTFWAFKPEVTTQLENSGALFLLPESFVEDIASGPSPVDNSLSQEQFTKNFRNQLMKSPIELIRAFRFQSNFSKLVEPYDRWFFSKITLVSVALITAYMTLASSLQWAIGESINAKKQEAAPVVSKYFDVKNRVDSSDKVIKQQQLLLQQQKDFTGLVLALESMYEQHNLVIRRINYVKGKLAVNVESKNANDFVAALSKNVNVSDLSIKGSVTKASRDTGRDKFLVEFNWNGKVWN